MRRTVIAVAILAAACGGGSGPTMPTETPSLVQGTYALQISSSGAGCLVISFGTPVPPPTPAITIDLDVVPAGSDWRGTLGDRSKGTLVMTAALTRSQFHGALNGVALDGSKSVTFLGGTHVMTGSSTGKANQLAGGFPAGVLVTFFSSVSEDGTSTVTCPNTVWVLSPK
jgi:hypothetical protein